RGGPAGRARRAAGRPARGSRRRAAARAASPARPARRPAGQPSTNSTTWFTVWSTTLSILGDPGVPALPRPHRRDRAAGRPAHDAGRREAVRVPPGRGGPARRVTG